MPLRTRNRLDVDAQTTLSEAVARFRVEPSDPVMWSVRDLAPTDLAPSDVRAWGRLEQRAVEANACLSPHFVLPALRHLHPAPKDVRVLLVERTPRDGARELVAVGVFHRSLGDRSFPAPHWRAYTSVHSPVGTPMVDRRCVQPALKVMLDRLGQGSDGVRSVVVPLVDPDGPVAQALQALTAERGAALRWGGVQERAMLRPAMAGEASAREALGTRRHKDLLRCERRLAERGPVAWNGWRNGPIAEAGERFLDLEHAGWKGECGDSLRSSPGGEAFFREMVAGFAAEGRALFTELSVAGRAIASTANVVSGDTLLAFKIGWDPAYRAMSVGMLNELAFVRQAADLCGDLAWVDSGAAPDSFIGQLWPDRRRIGLLVAPLSRRADLVAASCFGLRSLSRHPHRKRWAAAAVVAGALATSLAWAD